MKLSNGFGRKNSLKISKTINLTASQAHQTVVENKKRKMNEFYCGLDFWIDVLIKEEQTEKT
jgi:hypothetical protein